ncbi:hypothetical protein [Hyphomicrobium sp.]|uniref:hypothetical protein n=1 Tax=Hyphomicrobium sp. TaxID=82 RepID=UPI0025C1FBD4|nr:hypothetical protein [Hyphomicrobium sp.]MCC7253718.1 hypothetical protein [Hyphomicrobium sp.]
MLRWKTPGARKTGMWMAALALVLTAFGFARGAGGGAAELIPIKLGLESITKAERDKLWERVDEYATVDALLEFCGRKLNLQRRTWAAVSPCVEVRSLRKVAGVFRAKKAEYVKAWETAFAEPDKKKTMCDSQKPKLAEYTRILDAHISEAATMCSACIFC